MPVANTSFIQYLNATQRMLLSLMLGIIGFTMSHSLLHIPIISILVGWILFSITFLTFSWIIIYTMPTEQIKQLAIQEDGPRLFIHIFILLCSITSLVAIVAAAIALNNHDKHQIIYLIVAVSSLMCAWLIIHTLYIFHYARMYYGNDSIGGLEFPGNEEPDYLDFAYFSLDMGTTFQVSDVMITSKKIRQTVMFHGLLAFGLNTFVVAMIINLIATLIG